MEDRLDAYAIQTKRAVGDWYTFQSVSASNTEAFARKRYRYFQNRHPGQPWRLVAIYTRFDVLEWNET